MNPQYIDIHTHRPMPGIPTLRSAGIHPWDAETGSFETLLPLPGGVQAIGEIGLDYACKADRTRQAELFRRQLALAEAEGLPVVLHCVRAFELVMEELARHTLRAVVFHGFIGSSEQAARAIARGYYLSFGVRTFASPRTVEALKSLPADLLFLETDEDDTPIETIYAQVAALRGVTVAELQRTTTENYEKLIQR